MVALKGSTCHGSALEGYILVILFSLSMHSLDRLLGDKRTIWLRLPFLPRTKERLALAAPTLNLAILRFCRLRKPAELTTKGCFNAGKLSSAMRTPTRGRGPGQDQNGLDRAVRIFVRKSIRRKGGIPEMALPNKAWYLDLPRHGLAQPIM